MKINWRLIFTDVRIWILIFFLIRLVGITNPPLDTAHSWRQITGNMVSRNFLEIDANIMYPRVDMAGEKSGITGTEFPLLNYLIYLVAYLFGWQHWYGRLIVLLISSLGCWYFSKIARRIWGDKIAFNSTLFLLASNWFIYSRKIMPDTFSVSLVIIGVYFTLLYVDKKKILHLIIAGTMILLGGLSKIPALLVAVPLAGIILSKQTARQTKYALFLCFTIVSAPIVLWYFYWVPLLVEKFNYWHYYMGTNLADGFYELTQNLKGTAEKFYFDALKYSGFLVFLWGIFVLFSKKAKSKKETYLQWILLIEVLIFALFMAKAGRNFWVHSYYIIPFVPIMALVAGYALSTLKSKKIATLLLLFVIVEGIGNQQHDFRIAKPQQERLEYERWADSFSDKNSLFIINGGDNPKDLYFTHRKGWSISPMQSNNLPFIDSLSNCGAKYLWIHKTEIPMLKFPKSIVFENQSVVVFEL